MENTNFEMELFDIDMKQEEYNNKLKSDEEENKKDLENFKSIII